MLPPQETLWMQRILLRETDIGLFYCKIILDFLRKEWLLCSLAGRYKAHSSAYSKSEFEPILINSATKVSVSYIYVACNQKNTSIAWIQTHFLSWSLCHIHSDTIINQSQHLAFAAVFHDVHVQLGYCHEHRTRKNILIFISFMLWFLIYKARSQEKSLPCTFSLYRPDFSYNQLTIIRNSSRGHA